VPVGRAGREGKGDLMSVLNRYSLDGKVLGTVEAPSAIFDVPAHDGAVFEAVCMIQANRRRGTASTKNRSAVRGGGRKPWRQKGTGRARHGTRSSPLWVGGGRAFGPTPRDYRYSMPRKKQHLALSTALSEKAKAGKIIVVDEWTAERAATKEMRKRLDNFVGRTDFCLVLLKEKNRNVLLSMRNIPRAATKVGRNVSVWDVLRADVIIMEQACLSQLEEVLTS
jgi:large subunit ribosomal protein L4